jgi:SAM-dependent methyltransferase
MSKEIKKIITLMTIKFLGFFFRSRRHYLLKLISFSFPRFDRECPLCGYVGKFDYFGIKGFAIRNDAVCPNCLSLERHRLFWLYLKATDEKNKPLEPALHFAPETILEKKLREIFNDYKTSDLFSLNVDLKLNIENLDLEDASLGSVFCFHVLEHVDDKKALFELRRVIKKDGKLFIMVPLVEGWESTYENPDIKDPSLRLLHFGQHDHVRFYGRDFRHRIRAAGFENIEEFTAFGESVIKYGLLRGEKLFICS